ncbi:MAG: redoxin domain-containing protein [Chitinophagaceae bacterium]|nr:MAG: redoxin domain-containing protein [Chitinophagaceae bacterium]
MSRILLILTLLVPFVTTAQIPALVDTSLFSSYSLQHSRGQEEFVTIDKEPLNVLVFLSPECPLSINYTKPLNELASDYAGKVKFIGIVPGKSYSATTVQEFVSEYKVGFDVYIDKEKRFTKAAKATITPEVVVFSTAGNIIYRGAIDDWAIAVGKKKQKAFNKYLNNAIQAFLLGKEISVKSTKPVGCLINDY